MNGNPRLDFFGLSRGASEGAGANRIKNDVDNGDA